MDTEVISKLKGIVTMRPPGEKLTLAAQAALNAYYSYEQAKRQAASLDNNIRVLMQKAHGALSHPSTLAAGAAIANEAAMQTRQLQALKNQMNSLKIIFNKNVESAKRAQEQVLQLEQDMKMKQNAARKATMAGHATFVNAVKTKLPDDATREALNSNLKKFSNQSQQRNYAQFVLASSTMNDVKKTLKNIKNKKK